MDEKQWEKVFEIRVLEYMKGNIVQTVKLINDGELFSVNGSMEGGDFWFAVYKSLEDVKGKLDESITRRRNEIKK